MCVCYLPTYVMCVLLYIYMYRERESYTYIYIYIYMLLLFWLCYCLRQIVVLVSELRYVLSAPDAPRGAVAKSYSTVHV